MLIVAEETNIVSMWTPQKAKLLIVSPLRDKALGYFYFKNPLYNVHLNFSLI